ncbi:hypothetical protein [Xanthobacter agilis]|uniref:hypothetical protein n=1 Tax=Xanthobacter agilis TaxID=47492 RepID=UPI003728E02A
MMPDDAAAKHVFDRDKVCYEQNFQQFRAMNQIMWQVPLLAVSITGGLWYAAFAVAGMQEFGRPIFLLGGTLDLVLIAVLWRIRFVMDAYLEKLKAFHPEAFVQASGRGLFNWQYTVIGAFTLVLLVAGAGSFIGFFNLDWLKFEKLRP